MLPISEKDLQNVLKDMDISDINHATIRQCVNVAHELEHISGDKFVHLEFGIPGINACEVGVAAQKKALDEGVASIYPPASGTTELKQNGARFVKAFTGIRDPRTVRKRYPMDASGHISAATLARQLCGSARK